jgi:putative component of toxin-antitoxin plasmid stabilization module
MFNLIYRRIPKSHNRVGAKINHYKNGDADSRKWRQNLDGFKKIYDVEKEKLPYRINLIDELRPTRNEENAHSRIFNKLLQYNENGKFLILESFFKRCNFNLTVEKPNILKQDTMRIDNSILDKGYAVIIENKIKNAPDRPNQIANYIDKIRNTQVWGQSNRICYALENIYVIYTPQYAGQEPGAQSWTLEDGYSYREEFEERYRLMSYKEDILPWLKEDVLPNIGQKQREVYLRSAIEQYIDYLEGERMFNIRNINKEMNMKLQETIKKELGIQENNPGEALEILAAKKEEMENDIEQIKLLKFQIIKKSYFLKWKEQLKKDFRKYEMEEQLSTDEYPKIGLKFPVREGKISVLIEKDEEDRIYYGIQGDKKQKISRKLQKLITDRKDQGAREAKHWHIREYSSYQDVYGCFKTLVEEIIEKTQ